MWSRELPFLHPACPAMAGLVKELVCFIPPDYNKIQNKFGFNLSKQITCGGPVVLFAENNKFAYYYLLPSTPSLF
jgi:hypothetical protein